MQVPIYSLHCILDSSTKKPASHKVKKPKKKKEYSAVSNERDNDVTKYIMEYTGMEMPYICYISAYPIHHETPFKQPAQLKCYDIYKCMLPSTSNILFS